MVNPIPDHFIRHQEWDSHWKGVKWFWRWNSPNRCTFRNIPPALLVLPIAPALRHGLGVDFFLWFLFQCRINGMNECPLLWRAILNRPIFPRYRQKMRETVKPTEEKGSQKLGGLSGGNVMLINSPLPLRCISYGFWLPHEPTVDNPWRMAGTTQFLRYEGWRTAHMGRVCYGQLENNRCNVCPSETNNSTNLCSEKPPAPIWNWKVRTTSTPQPHCG